jgi:hypothetical protein
MLPLCSGDAVATPGGMEAGVQRGDIRRLQWGRDANRGATLRGRGPANLAAPAVRRAARTRPVAAEAVAALDPPPASAEEETVALLRIAAEIEGALMVQYLFAAGSVMQGVSVEIDGFDHPILSDDWYDLTRTVAKQEMGHLITVQNLLLSLNVQPHVDRENLPLSSPLYPFPFSLQTARQSTLAKYVCAEAPHEVAAADRADYEDAVRQAGAIVGDVPRAGQIYERLFWLLQDSDEPQEPWPDLKNPFPDWPKWHVDARSIGFNQDRQASPDEWRGDDASAPADTGIYVLQVADKASARLAVYTIGAQGEGPEADPGSTHFDKFLRLFRERRAVDAHAGSPAFVRNQADDPKTGISGPATITDPKTLAWARLGNLRYQMLLVDIALAVSVGPTGTAPSVSAARSDFSQWAFREMLTSIKPLSAELCQMPLAAGASPTDPRAGLPYELPNTNLPDAIADQIQYLRDHAASSVALRAAITASFNPTPKQVNILRAIGNIDTAIQQKLSVGS